MTVSITLKLCSSVYVCLSLSLSLSLTIFVSVCLSASLSLSSLYTSYCQSQSLCGPSIHFYLSVTASLCLCTSVSIYLSFHPHLSLL
jgi:hypothetical protein